MDTFSPTFACPFPTFDVPSCPNTTPVASLSEHELEPLSRHENYRATMHARSTPWLNCQLDPSFHAQITANSGARQWSLVGCPTLTPTFILEGSI